MPTNRAKYCVAVLIRYSYRVGSCIRSMTCFPPYRATLGLVTLVTIQFHRHVYGNFELFFRLLIPLSAWNHNFYECIRDVKYRVSSKGQRNKIMYK